MSTSRATLAAVLIVKNEAKHLKACLETLTWVDEIIVLDSGSSDDTQAIAKQFNANVYENTPWPGFGPQRRIAQQYASCDWILAIDADERVTPELQASIEQALTENNTGVIYDIARRSWVFGRFLKHSGWYPDRVMRLYARERTQYNDALVHEKVEVVAGMRTASLQGDLLHYTYDDLHHYLVKSAGYAKAWADQRQKKGKKSSIGQGLLHALACFLKMYVFKAGFLDGKQGLLIAILSAHSTFVKYADLWIRQVDGPTTKS